MKITVTFPGQEPATYPGVMVNKAPLKLLDRLRIETKFGMKAFAQMEEEGDVQLAAVLAYLAMNKAGTAVRYADLMELSLDDIDIENEPGDPGYVEPDAELAEDEVEPDPTKPAPEVSAPAGDDVAEPQEG